MSVKEKRQRVIEKCIEDLKFEMYLSIDKRRNHNYRRYWISESKLEKFKPFLIKLFNTGYKEGSENG